MAMDIPGSDILLAAPLVAEQFMSMDLYAEDLAAAFSRLGGAPSWARLMPAVPASMATMAGVSPSSAGTSRWVALEAWETANFAPLSTRPLAVSCRLADAHSTCGSRGRPCQAVATSALPSAT
jgi:hypothetical protein